LPRRQTWISKPFRRELCLQAGFLGALRNDKTLVLEIKGMETEQDRAKHEAARRWVSAVDNWGEQGQWEFHVNRGPQVLGQELEWLASQSA
jgi:type III restriction enzyme